MENGKALEEKSKSMVNGQARMVLRSARYQTFGFMACMMILSFVGGYLTMRLATSEKLVVAYMEERRVEVQELRSKLDTALSELVVVRQKLAALELIKQTLLTDVSRRSAREMTDTIENRVEREKQYDWLLEQNTKRLFDGKQPCRSLLECAD